MTGRDTFKNIAVIPARGGSKRIPRKNIKPFCGKPILSYSIETAKKTGLFERIIVSTDDPQIAQTASEWGADIPFFRPKELADDFTTTTEVIKHAVDWLNKNDSVYDHACCIYPTAPFIRTKDIEKGYELLKQRDVYFSFPVATFPSSIFRALRITKGNRIKMFQPEHVNTRTQDLPEAYHDAGQFYWGKTEAFLEGHPLFGGHACPIIIPRYLAQDIDTPEDWEQAELLFQALNSSNSAPKRPR